MEKKEVKKQLKVCKKQIKKSNITVRGFMKQQKFRKGSYGKLQHTGIWKKAKEQLLEYYLRFQYDLTYSIHIKSLLFF